MNKEGTGKGYRLSQKTRDEIRELYSKGHGFSNIGYRLNIGKNTARRHVYQMKKEGVL